MRNREYRLRVLETQSRARTYRSPGEAWLATLDDDRDLEALEVCAEVQEGIRDSITVPSEIWARREELIDRYDAWCRDRGL